jgi:hypothetical protein
MGGLVANPLLKVLSKKQDRLPLDFRDEPNIWK